MQQLLSSRRMTALFEAYYNVCGLPPNVNNIGYHEKFCPFQDHWGGIKRTHAIFKGIRRPCKEAGGDKDIHVYVVKPKYRFEHIVHMICCAQRVEVPKNVLFVALVHFANEQHTGEVLNWEWVEADPDGSDKPIDYKSRYDEEVWSNG